MSSAARTKDFPVYNSWIQCCLFRWLMPWYNCLFWEHSTGPKRHHRPNRDAAVSLQSAAGKPFSPLKPKNRLSLVLCCLSYRTAAKLFRFRPTLSEIGKSFMKSGRVWPDTPFPILTPMQQGFLNKASMYDCAR